MKDIILSGLSKTFCDHVVFNDFSMVIPIGKVTCLMAPSGAGKTTLLRILLGLLSADSGSISNLEGHTFSVVFQEDRLLEQMTPISNIRLVSPALSRESILTALEGFGLRNCAEQPVEELSGGMKRRVSLLRALLSDGDFLILDEPFKGLDEGTKQLVIQKTLDLSKDRTVLFVTHDPIEASLMHAETILLKYGKTQATWFPD